MMKRAMSLLLAVVMLMAMVALCGCGGGEESKAESKKTSNSASQNSSKKLSLEKTEVSKQDLGTPIGSYTIPDAGVKLNREHSLGSICVDFLSGGQEVEVYEVWKDAEKDKLWGYIQTSKAKVGWILMVDQKLEDWQ